MSDNFVTCRHCGIGIWYACDHGDDDVQKEEVDALRSAHAQALALGKITKHVNESLAAQVEDVKTENGTLRLLLGRAQKDRDHYAFVVKQLWEALFFYSNPEIYEETSMRHGFKPACGPPIVIEDGGERARRALAAPPEEKP